MVQWLKCHTSTAGGTGLSPGQGIKIFTCSAAKKKKGKRKRKEGGEYERKVFLELNKNENISTLKNYRKIKETQI